MTFLKFCKVYASILCRVNKTPVTNRRILFFMLYNMQWWILRRLWGVSTPSASLNVLTLPLGAEKAQIWVAVPL